MNDLVSGLNYSLNFGLVVFVANIILLYLYLKISHRYHWFDKPDEQRKLHQLAKPTAAGLIFMLPILLALLFVPLFFPWHDYSFVLTLLVLLVLGGIDDFINISAKIRLIVITLVSGYFLYSLFNGENVNYLLLAVYLIGLIWWLNLYNFMDGADGMVTLHAIVVICGYMIAYIFFAYIWLETEVLLAMLPLMLLCLFCLLSFLGFNFPVAKMFMGDSGSLSVAFILAGFALYGLSKNIFDEILVISFHLVFIVDATLTLLTRLKFKHKISQAHDLHYYQAMIHTGKSHAVVSLIYALLTILTVIIALYLQYWQYSLTTRMVVLLLEVTILAFFWMKFHNITNFERFVK